MLEKTRFRKVYGSSSLPDVHWKPEYAAGGHENRRFHRYSLQMAKHGSGNSGKKMVTYNFNGTVAAVTTASINPTTGETVGSNSVTVEVQKGNKAARDFVVANRASQTFNIDSNTKVEINEDEDATLADVQTGDEVKVQVKASSAAAPHTSRQLTVENEDD